MIAPALQGCLATLMLSKCDYYLYLWLQVKHLAPSRISGNTHSESGYDQVSLTSVKVFRGPQPQNKSLSSLPETHKTCQQTVFLGLLVNS